MLGLVLCLLAAVFAIEAKVAWFSPAGSPSAQISSAKLQPADAPRLIANVLAAPANLHPVAQPEAPSLLLFIAVLAIAASPIRRAVHHRLKVSGSPSFSPPLFLRPPPQF